MQTDPFVSIDIDIAVDQSKFRRTLIHSAFFAVRTINKSTIGNAVAHRI